MSTIVSTTRSKCGPIGEYGSAFKVSVCVACIVAILCALLPSKVWMPTLDSHRKLETNRARFRIWHQLGLSCTLSRALSSSTMLGSNF